jgi:hypothetical protein
MRAKKEALMRLIALLIAGALFGALGFATNSLGSSSFPHGDVDCDGDRDSVDALRILQDLAATNPLPAGCQAEATPQPTPTGPVISFGDGTHIVGTDIDAGTYRNSDSSGGCYWERLSGFGGTLGEIIANNFSDHLQIVTINPTDVGFSSTDCGTWAPPAGPITSSPTAPFGDGMYIVGTDVAPGTWRNEASDGCYWERLSGFTGEIDDIIANEFSDDQQIVTISESDVAFQSDNCGTWTKIG